MTSPQSAQTRELLRAQFFQWRELHPSAHLYVLLDCNHPVSEDDTLHPKNLLQREIQRPLHLVHRPDLAHSAELLPQLLQVRAVGESGYVDEALLEDLITSQLARCASVNGSYVALWLCAEEEPEVLAERLGRNGFAMSLAQARQRYLPWFEPHRLSLLMAESTSEKLVRQWTLPALHWAWVDAASHVQQGTRPTNTDAESETRAAMSKAAWASQDRLTLTRLTILALRKAGSRPAERIEQRVDGWLAAAQAQGLKAQQDLVFFALNCASLGSDWHEHPTARRLIAASANDEEVRLATRMEALSDQELNDLASSP